MVRRPQGFYGWRIVGIAACAQAVSAGSTFFVYGILVKPLAAEFDASRLAVTLGLTLLVAMQGLISPTLGRALDHYPVRVIMAAGVVLLGVGLWGLSAATAFWQIGALFATAIAIGSHMFGPLATVTLSAKWFVRLRGRALGFTAVGASLGGVVFPLIAAGLLESFGWRVAMRLLAGGVLALALPIWLLVRSRPEDMGQRPDGDSSAGEVLRSGPTAPGPATRELLTSRNFWAITAMVGLCWLPTSVLLAHLVPYATDIGIGATRAALLMSAYSAAGAVGRVGFGLIADRFDKRHVTWGVLAVLSIGWAGLLGEPPFPQLLMASSFMGFGVGGIMPLWGSLTGACFGREVFGRVMGLMNPLMLPFNLAGAPIAAYVYDRTHSYGSAFGPILAAFALAAVAVALLRLPEVEPGATPAAQGANA